MSNAQQATTTQATKPARAVRLPARAADNTNGAPPPIPEQLPRLTPALVRAVLRELERKEDIDIDDIVRIYLHDDDGHGLVAAAEATAAADRAGSVKPVIDVIFAQFSCWARAPFVDFGELRGRREQSSLQALKALKHTIYAVIGGAYGELDYDKDAAMFEELAEQCDLVGEASDDEEVKIASDVASWMISMVTYLLVGGSEMERRTCLSSTHECAKLVGGYLAERKGEEAFGAFIDALRSIGQG